MPKFLQTLFLAMIIVGGGWIFTYRDQFKTPKDVWDFLVSRMGPTETVLPIAIPSRLSAWPTREKEPQRIRVASYALKGSTSAVLDEQTAAEILAETLSQFDVTVIPEISPERRRLLLLAVALLQFKGFPIGSTLTTDGGGAVHHATSAFVFNTTTVQLDQAFPMPLAGEPSAFSAPPLVGWFRALNIPNDQALTFTLVTVQMDPRFSDQFVVALAELFRTVRKDRRNEDDIILCGDFHIDAARGRHTEHWSGLTGAFSGPVGNSRGGNDYDNFIYAPRATTELTGAKGQLDLLKLLNLTAEELTQISVKLPIWIEFSIFEGADGSRMAGPPAMNPKR